MSKNERKQALFDESVAADVARQSFNYHTPPLIRANSSRSVNSIVSRSDSVPSQSYIPMYPTPQQMNHLLTPSAPPTADNSLSAFMSYTIKCETCLPNRSRCKDCKKKYREYKKTVRDSKKRIENVESGRSLEDSSFMSKSLERLTIINNQLIKRVEATCNVYKKYLITCLSILTMLIVLYGFSVFAPHLGLNVNALTNGTDPSFMTFIQNILPKHNPTPLSINPVTDSSRSHILIQPDDSAHHLISFDCTFWSANCNSDRLSCFPAARKVQNNLEASSHLIRTGPPLSNIHQTSCLSLDEFTKVMPRFKYFFDDSDTFDHNDKNITTKEVNGCCQGQYRQYMTHGCQSGFSFEEWLWTIEKCLQTINDRIFYAVKCSWNSILNCNHVYQISTNRPITTFGCKTGEVCQNNPTNCSVKQCELLSTRFSIEVSSDNSHAINSSFH